MTAARVLVYGPLSLVVLLGVLCLQYNDYIPFHFAVIQKNNNFVPISAVLIVLYLLYNENISQTIDMGPKKTPAGYHTNQLWYLSNTSVDMFEIVKYSS